MPIDPRNIVVIYHDNCLDGLGAAMAAVNCFGYHPTYHPGVYGKEPPDVTGKHVFLVDFSYPYETLLKMLETCVTLAVLDHHKTAMEDLQGKPRTTPVACSFTLYNALRVGRSDTIDLVLDNDRSGAMIAWDFFGGVMPALIPYIQDRDLWRFQLEGSKEIAAALGSYPKTMEVWDSLVHEQPSKLIALGEPLLRQHEISLDSVETLCGREMTIGGHTGLVASAPYFMASDLGGRLAKNAAFGGTYYDTATTRVFSLRSTKDVGIDVSAIAKQFGGGGHKHAAGFLVPRSHELAKN